MSRWSERSSEDRWSRRDEVDRRREEQEQFRGDVIYQVWRSGGNPDRINDDRLSDRYWDGQNADEAASAELRSQHPHPEPCYDEPEYPIQDYSGEIPDNQ
jgi:hypothetical protein